MMISLSIYLFEEDIAQDDPCCTSGQHPILNICPSLLVNLMPSSTPGGRGHRRVESSTTSGLVLPLAPSTITVSSDGLFSLAKIAECVTAGSGTTCIDFDDSDGTSTIDQWESDPSKYIEMLLTITRQTMF